jgi:predicted DNA-binding ribbon-helix-helix protein
MQRKSMIPKRSVKISGRQSCISLEDEFWYALQDIAKEQHESVKHLELWAEVGDG